MFPVKTRLLPLAAALLCLALALSAMPARAEEASGTPLLTLDQTELTLVKGKTQKLKAALENADNPRKAKFAWESSDAAVATVDGGGSVRARDGGSAEITCTATLEDGSVLTASAAVTVTVPVQGVKILTKGNTPVPYGESLQLEYSVQPENATNQKIVWTSSDENVLRVDENGVVTAVSAGKANVTGTAEDSGRNARVSLYVPTLHPSSDAFAVTATDNVFHFTYCGNDFDRNVQLAVKGSCFEYELIRNDPDIGVALTPLAAGEGTLTVTDRKDGAAKFTVKITVTDDAFPIGKTLLIRDAAYDPETGFLTLTWVNTGSTTVTGAEIRVIPRDADGNQVLAGEGYMEEIIEETRTLHTSAVSEPEKTVTVTLGTGMDYPAAAAMEIAFDRIEKTVYAEDGSVAERAAAELPDDRLCWYSTAENAYTSGPENGEPYEAPDGETFARAAGVHIGITTIPVTGELADAYGFAYGGLLIVAVEEGSPAERIGLEKWDLIFSVNGADYEEEPYMMTLAAAELAAGRPVTMLLQRDNEFWELAMAGVD